MAYRRAATPFASGTSDTEKLTQMVTVEAGKTAMADFSYTGQEAPNRARIQDVFIPERILAIHLGGDQ